MVRTNTRSSWARLWGFSIFLAAALAFLVPGFVKTGSWPSPLDDTYIYFGFARATALGSPLAWQPGNGYSSGATSLLYPLVLAPFWALGLRGRWLGLGAALIALASLVDLDGRLEELLDGAGSRGAVRVLAPLTLIAVPLLNWSLFSGMETALFAALLGRALAAGHRALSCDVEHRPRAQLNAGLWCAALTLGRPEATLSAIFIAVAVVHGARSLSTRGSLRRCALPLVLTVSSQFTLNRALTGEWQPAGVLRKLLTEQPHASGSTITLEFGKNLVVLSLQAFIRAFGGTLGALALTVLVGLAVCLPGQRRLAAALVLGALGSLLLVCLNATARYQNYRYAAPSQLMLLIAAIFGASALAQRLARYGPRQSLFALVPLGFLIAAPIQEWPKQIDHFARSSRNIEQQQCEVARRLSVLSPKPRRVLVGDAGAIPYLSELPALDGLGLGGYHRLPFARASLEGDAAIVELIERMPLEERPDWMALYPGWWSELIARFGTRVDAVRIDDNVICGGDEKVIYRSDFSDLQRVPDDGSQSRSNRLDLGDLISEQEHEVTLDRHTGEAISATRLLDDGQARWDGGRRVGLGFSLGFRLDIASNGFHELTVRTDTLPASSTPFEVRIRTEDGARTTVPLSFDTCLDPTHWCALRATLDLRKGDRIELLPTGTELRAFEVTAHRSNEVTGDALGDAVLYPRIVEQRVVTTPFK